MAAANPMEHNDNNNIPEFEQLLVDNFEDGIIDDEEFLLLLQNYRNDVVPPLRPAHAQQQGQPGRGRNINIPHRNYPPFNFATWTEDECWVDLRFFKADIPHSSSVQF